MKEDKSTEKKIDSDIANLTEKIPHQIKNNNISEEKKELLKADKDKHNGNEKLKEIKNNKKENDKKKFNFKYEKIGATYIFLTDKDGNPLITIGPNWRICILFFSVIIIVFLLLFYFFWNFLNIFLRIFGILNCFVFSYTYIHILITDPGIPKRIDEETVNKSNTRYVFCKICKNWVCVKSGAVHCSQCDICIEGYDQHCPWVSKCIGRKNIHYFYFLALWLVIIIFYLIFAFLIASEKFSNYRQSQLKLLRMKK